MSVKKYNPLGLLSNFYLKIIAIITMTIDHVGIVFFPRMTIFRIIGRIAFPIFAFLIAEGCSYTKNKLKRFLTISIIGIAYLLAYYIYAKVIYASIFVTFSFSMFFIFMLMDIKKLLFTKRYTLFGSMVALFMCLLVLTYIIFDKVHIDYGFYGMLIPVVISLFDFRKLEVPNWLRKLDCFWIKFISLLVSLILFSQIMTMGGIQIYCLLSLVFIILYNGKPGPKGFKYGFYIYYPVHLLVIEGLFLIL